MQKQPLKFILLISFFSILVVLVLYFMSANEKNLKNGFSRVFHTGNVYSIEKFDLKYPGYYIAGFTSNNLYLGNYKTPLHIIKTDYDLVDTIHLTPRLPNTTKFRWKHARIFIDSPNVYIGEGITPALFHSTIDKLTFTTFMEQSAYFTYFVPISPSSLVLKSVQAKPKENMILKQMNYGPHYFKKATGVLDKQLDGLFCTNGMLNYDKKNSKIIYLYHYRNEFICMDSSLTVLYKGNTIDTTSQAKLKVATIKSEGSVTLASPPTIVNKKSRVFNNLLFVQSALMADNEQKNEIGKKTVIDTYSLTKGKYLFSFYIPSYEDQKLNDFQIVNNLIIALYDHHLFIYGLNLQVAYNQKVDQSSGNFEDYVNTIKK